MTAALMTDAPMVDSPMRDAFLIDSPKTDSPPIDRPSIAVPMSDAPTIDRPRIAVPMSDAPKSDSPMTDAPKVDLPMVDSPMTDAPKVDLPMIDSPMTAALLTAAPTIGAPMTDRPMIDVTNTSRRSALDRRVVPLDRRQFLHLTATAGASLLLGSRLRAASPASKPLPPVAEESALIAFGHVGPVADECWTWSHDQGMKAVQAAFPRLKTVMVESIPFSADASRIFRRFVSQGAHMVFATSNYGDFLYDVAKRAPDVAFCECDGRNPLANLGTYYVAHWYPSFVAGVAAGLLSKSGRLGYVASFPVPTVHSGANAFLLGARTTNPRATMQVIAINKWFDPQAATQAGSALIDNGADLLFGVMDEAGYLQVAEKRGVKAVMWNTDVRRYGPKAYVSSIVVDFKKFYVEQVRLRLAGNWTPPVIILPMGGGVDVDAWGETVPEEVRRRANEVHSKILGGWSPFVGPLKDSKGATRVAAGTTMTETELYNWDWSIDGVVGV